LFESAMDAIVELNQTFAICRANRAGLEMFGLEDRDAAGKSFFRLLTENSGNKLRGLARQLEDHPHGHLWVSGGLEGCRAGERFPAEASLSRFQLGTERRYTVILRNVRDQIEAERKICTLTSESAYLQEEIGNLYNFGEI